LKNNWQLRLIAILLMGLGIGYFLITKSKSMVAKKPVETFPLYLNCPDAVAGVLQFNGRALVLSKVAQKMGLLAAPIKAVDRQIQFLDGDIHFGLNLNTEPKIVLERGSHIEVLSVKPVKYGYSLEIDGNEYGLENGVREDDPAFMIEYRAEKAVTVCKGVRDGANSLWVHLPIDPYLAYWFVAPQQRRPIVFRNHHLTTNPCVDRSFVEIDDPSEYWYAWNPTETGIDANGESYDCARILKPDSDYLAINARLNLARPNKSKVQFDQLLSTPSWQISVIFGFVSRMAEEKTLADAKSFFSMGFHPMGEVSRESQDAAVWALIDFVNQLKGLADLGPLEFVENGQSLTWSSKGRLRKLGKPFQLNIYLGPTSVDSADFKRFLISAIARSQFLFYTGHSGMGQKMDWSGIKNNFSATLPYQLLFLIGCFSDSYFDRSYVEFRNEHHLSTDVLLTDFQSYRYLLPIRLLEYINQIESDDRMSLTEELTKELDRHEVLAYTREGI